MLEAKATHPTRDQLTAFVGGTLSAAEQTQVETHVAECDACCQVLRSLPHESLVRRMRPSDTSNGLDETHAGMASETDGQRDPIGQLPPELAEHARYRIVKQLGAGGMGVVYQAEHRLMQRPVALKVINRQLVNNQVAIERFHLEVRAAARLSHRNIVTAYDAEQAGDLHFLVMEYVEGISLSQLVEQRGRQSSLHACNYVMQAAQGLQHAAEQGMVHRDVKPQNLMRTPRGTIKILDFGLARLASEIDTARLTRAGVALGTADYIAPEQVEDSRHVDIRADIYSLGCTLYYLLAGHVLFPSGTLVDRVLAHLHQTPPSLAEIRPDIPLEVVQIVQQMLAKDPAERFQSPADVVEALKPFGRPNTAAEEPAGSSVAATAVPPQVITAPQVITPPEVISPPPTLDASVLPAPWQQADPFDISQLDEQVRPLPSLAPPTRRRKALPARLQLLRFGLPAGILGLLVLAGVLLVPQLRAVLNELGNGAAVHEPEQGNEAIRHGDWIDVISGVDPASQAIAGQWQKQGVELAVDEQEFARLVLPAEMPEQYDFEVSFTRNSGEDSVALFFVAGGGRATLEIDAWRRHLAGIQNIGGQTMAERTTGVGSMQLHNGTRYTALVCVRRGHVTASLDGQPLATYAGDGSDLSVFDSWQLPGRRTLGVGAHASATTFHCIRVREVTSVGTPE